MCREGENFLCEWRRVLHGERPFKPLKILVQVRKEILSVAYVHNCFFQMTPCLMMYCCFFFQFRCILLNNAFYLFSKVHTICHLCYIQNYGCCFLRLFFLFAFMFIKLLSSWFSLLLPKRDVEIS